MAEYGASTSYTYLEGSHGCDRCNWCHADNVHTPPGQKFPHKDSCPTLTIQRLEEALTGALANGALGQASAAIPPAIRALIERLDEAHMFACDIASNGTEPEKLAVIGSAIRDARSALRASIGREERERA